MQITQEIIGAWHQHVFGDWIKEIEVEWETVEEGLITARLENKEKYCSHLKQGKDRMYGQVIMALTDTMSFMVLYTTPIKPLGTLTQHSSFIGAAKGPFFKIECRVKKLGKRISHVETTWHDSEDTLVFHSVSSFTMMEEK